MKLLFLVVLTAIGFLVRYWKKRRQELKFFEGMRQARNERLAYFDWLAQKEIENDLERREFEREQFDIYSIPIFPSSI